MEVDFVPTGTPPRWYVEALDVPCESSVVDVAGCPVSVRSWGSPTDSAVVLVHGAAAHAHWWDHVAPLLSHGRRVLALDLSGHGDSGRRPSYSLDTWAREVLAVAGIDGSSEPSVLIGHSLGGWVVAAAAHLAPHAVAGVITIDPAIAAPPPERDAARQRRAVTPLRVYPTREGALTHFRPLPEHEGLQDFVVDHVARHSLRESDGGWSWKFDPGVFGRHRPSARLFSTIPVPVAMLRAEHGLATDSASLGVYDQLRRHVLVVDIPDAGHHVMLDQPLALTVALRTVLSAWQLTSLSDNLSQVTTTVAGA